MEKVERKHSATAHADPNGSAGPGPDRSLYRFGAVAAALGVAVAVIRQLWGSFHPASPPDQHEAFAGYAAHGHWVVAHLGEFIGWVLVLAALTALTWKMRSGRAAGWAFLGAVGGAATMSLAAGLQAIDGVALKVMVDRWAAGRRSDELFEGAYAVRQIEGGFLALFVLMLSLTIIVYGIALLLDREAPAWLGKTGIVSGAMTVPLSMVLALDPFGEASGHAGGLGAWMTVGAVGNLVALVWVLLVGVQLYRWSRS